MGNPNLFICIHVCVYMFYTYILFVLSNSNRNVFCDSVCVCVHLRRAYACKIRKCKCIVYMHVAEY